MCTQARAITISGSTETGRAGLCRGLRGFRSHSLGDRRATAFALGSGCEATVILLFSIFHGPLRSWLHLPLLPASRLPCVHKGLRALHLLAGKPHSRLERGRRLRAGDPLFLALSVPCLCDCPGVAITKNLRRGACTHKFVLSQFRGHQDMGKATPPWRLWEHPSGPLPVLGCLGLHCSTHLAFLSVSLCLLSFSYRVTSQLGTTLNPG